MEVIAESKPLAAIGTVLLMEFTDFDDINTLKFSFNYFGIENGFEMLAWGTDIDHAPDLFCATMKEIESDIILFFIGI
jgi:hypothetical protein